MDIADADLAKQPPVSTLANGLRVRTLHIPDSQWAAALIRVYAGAHDAPQAYPGLAHFLEHVLFLGSREYPVAQSLMPFVQRSGGQLNASTRERYTDYFFQLPADLLEKGLLRLTDMLARPLLDTNAQLREREVLHAEFLARVEDSETLCDAALGTGVGGEHPFSAFHAGNRDSLPVQDAQFQQALRAYHQRFYHAGQMELLLAGPQTAQALQLLAKRATQALRSAPVVRHTPPRLLNTRDSWMRVQLKSGAPRLNLGYLLNGLPAGSAAALDYLAEYIVSDAPGGLAQRLRGVGWCESIRLRVPYWHEGQGVAVIEILLTEQGLSCRADIIEAVQGWLRFFADEGCWPQCREEYLRVRRRKLLGFEPLEHLRYWIEPEPWNAESDESEIHQAFRALMNAIIETQPIVLTAEQGDCPLISSAGFPLRLARDASTAATESRQWRWELPRPNPLLRASLLPRTGGPVSPALCWVEQANPSRNAALFLRWRFVDGPPEAGLFQLLWHALKTRMWAVRQAGVELRFDDFGSMWCMSLFGFAEALPAVLVDLGTLLNEPPATLFGRKMADRASDDVLLRQLINQLPLALNDVKDESLSPESLDKAALERCWQAARWDGLAIGSSDDLRWALCAAVERLPGAPSDPPRRSPSAASGLRWRSAGHSGGETALLLFCPLPAGEAGAEANWRLLARLMEADFFRRLRSELQLGYAVFCGFRQIGEQGGILFAVQSPTAQAAEILQHIEDFIVAFAGKLDACSAMELEQQASDLGALHLAALGNLRGQSEHIRHAWLAGQDATYPRQVGIALENITADALHTHLHMLRKSIAGWFVLANAPAPDSRCNSEPGFNTTTFPRDDS